MASYHPKKDKHDRDFVIVCGSRSVGTAVEHFKPVVEEKIKDFTNNSVKERLRFYLFDSERIVFLNGNLINEK